MLKMIKTSTITTLAALSLTAGLSTQANAAAIVDVSPSTNVTRAAATQLAFSSGFRHRGYSSYGYGGYGYGYGSYGYGAGFNSLNIGINTGRGFGTRGISRNRGFSSRGRGLNRSRGFNRSSNRGFRRNRR